MSLTSCRDIHLSSTARNEQSYAISHSREDISSPTKARYTLRFYENGGARKISKGLSPLFSFEAHDIKK